jgi:two-component system NtrC family sensor kinase
MFDINQSDSFTKQQCLSQFDGIPQKIVDKIFQPFFTTKPTGQGTGLGLSLSYDIIKAHGGEIRVETKENEGSEFVIQLPIK